ncbi:MAG TPA: hypothetical protein VHB20_03280 [Verrucomicrobiae bacterium]|jgi:hypothetical protein|nr:hypothetical protein [Verrucomicrobiae bacterium]
METLEVNRPAMKMLDFTKRFLAHRYLPAVLAIGAALVMLPALKTGLVADDLMQRAVELRPSQLPARMHETGNPADSGSFSTVLFDLFGLSRNPQDLALMKNYGTLPWWTQRDFRLSLCRPVAAFTHWLDYRFFPDSPALMHAHNIAWFAAVVFLVTLVYRELMGAGAVAGLAALLFLLDGYTYIPVMFVANRGFIMALFFGLLCLYEHHRWRSSKSRSALLLSLLCLAISVFAEEGGASTFAFIVAYALVLEPGSLRQKALTVLPSVLVLVLWRTIYQLSGYGLAHVGPFYIDPLNQPFQLARVMVPRMMLVLGGQLASVPPEILSVVKPSFHPAAVALYGVFVVAALLVFLPWVRRDKMAAFWLAVMLLAAIPESSLAPVSKNFGFVAIGAYGLMASFVAATMMRRWPAQGIRRFLAWTACAALLLVHVPGAMAGRIITAKAASFFIAHVSQPPHYWPTIENENIIAINFPCPLISGYVPGYKAYFHQPLPRTVRALAPASVGLTVQRTDDKTLVMQSLGMDLFSCDDLGPAHIAYFFSACNLLLGAPRCQNGDRYELSGLTVKVLESDAADLPSRVAFRFDTSLESPSFRWLCWNWRTFSVEPFKVPAIGQSITLAGPAR